jgi:hypothetical protein
MAFRYVYVCSPGLLADGLFIDCLTSSETAHGTAARTTRARLGADFRPWRRVGELAFQALYRFGGLPFIAQTPRTSGALER